MKHMRIYKIKTAITHYGKKCTRFLSSFDLKPITTTYENREFYCEM